MESTLANHPSFKEFQESIKRINEMFSQVKFSSEFIEQMNQAMSQFKFSTEFANHMKVINQYQTNFKDSREFKRMNESMRLLSHTIRQSTAPLQAVLRNYRIPELNLTPAEMEEAQSYWEQSDIQEEIQQQLSSIEDITEPSLVISKLNEWAQFILNIHGTIREKAPFLYTLLFITGFIANLAITPIVQDVIKEKVWHHSDQLAEQSSETPKKQVIELKLMIANENPEMEQYLGAVRVTERDCPVFRSQRRASGQIDTIPQNEPVIILHKNRNWSHVLYRDENQQEVTGWVFTRQLRK